MTLKKLPADWDSRTDAYKMAVLEAAKFVEDDVAEYLQDPPISQKEKAEWEEMIWQKVPAKLQSIIQSNKNKLGGDGYCARWLAYLLSDDLRPSPFNARDRLITASKTYDVEFVWGLLDNGASIGRVCDGLTEAKEAYAKAPDSEKRARFRTTLENYLMGEKTRDRTGRRKDSPKAQVQTPRQPPTPKPPAQTSTSARVNEAIQESKEVWNQLQESALEPLTKIVTDRLEGIAEPSVISEILQDFRLEVETCYQNTLRKIRAIRNRGLSQEILAAKQSQIVEAAQVLGIDAPTRNSKDWKGWRPKADIVKKSYWKLSTQFHPDKNNNDPRCAERYLAIQQSYELLKSVTQ